MSAILESFLDDDRRAECRANDGAMAMGQPIMASQPIIHPERTSRLHRTFNRVTRPHEEPARSERSNAARVATSERW